MSGFTPNTIPNFVELLTPAARDVYERVVPSAPSCLGQCNLCLKCGQWIGAAVPDGHQPCGGEDCVRLTIPAYTMAAKVSATIFALAPIHGGVDATLAPTVHELASSFNRAVELGIVTLGCMMPAFWLDLGWGATPKDGLTKHFAVCLPVYVTKPTVRPGRIEWEWKWDPSKEVHAAYLDRLTDAIQTSDPKKSRISRVAFKNEGEI